jgi:tetratricopeptide (TPR) repeat protein
VRTAIRTAALGLLVGLACAGLSSQDDRSPAARVRALADAGRVGEAETMARAGGASLAVPLGEVLLLQGKLGAADSAFSAAVRAGATDRRTAEAALAELSARRGDAVAAVRRAGALIAAYERDGASWSADDHTAAGRAYVVLGADDPQAFKAAVRAFEAALALDSSAVEPQLRLGDLFLDKYDAPNARVSYRDALKVAPKHPRALLGLARVLSFEGNPEATAALRASLAANASLAPAHVLLGRLYLDAEEYDSSRTAAARALAVDSTSIDAWALLGATAFLSGDSAEFSRARTRVSALHPRPALFYSEVAEAAARHRRYAEAARLGREGVALDSTMAPALGVLGINQLRLGDIDGGRALLEHAFARDPYHIWYKNTLDLLDELRTFKTIETRRFRIVAPAAEADLLAMYLGPLLEEAYDSLATRYEYQPPTPVRLELYRHHADFSVRTVGLTGLGALGVSFGTVLVMDAPSARDPGSFNFGTTAWHELAHTFTLGLSAHRVPRWLSEGLSVLEERRARPGWGADPSVEFLGAFKSDKLLPVTRLNEGFVRPSHRDEIGFSYYQASLLCEMIEQQWGRPALVAMLRGYRDGLETPAVFGRVLGLTPDALNARFAAFVRQKFATALAAIAPWSGTGPGAGEFVDAIRAAEALEAAGKPDEARAALERADKMFPEYAGQSAPALALARLHVARGDVRAAVAALARHNALDESALASNAEEARLRQDMGDLTGAAAALGRMLWISPYDAGMHARLAELLDQTGAVGRALLERRAVLAAGPADPLEARYQLARAMVRAGDAAGARREILAVLEAAPAFEKAQALLLELRGRAPQERER